MARSEYGWIARWLDNKRLVMAGVLLAGIGCEVGAFYLSGEYPLASVTLAGAGIAGLLLVLFGKVWPNNS